MNLAQEYLAQNKWRDWERMLEQLPKGRNQTVLDLGCGPGIVSNLLAARYRKVVGVDRDVELLDTARQLCPSNCEFVESDLGHYPYESISPVNGIWSSFTAAYFPRFVAILEQWRTCLAHGGWIAIVEIDDLLAGHHPLPTDIRASIEEFGEYLCSGGQYDFRMGRKVSNYCRAAGLTVISEHTFPDDELVFEGAASPEVIAAWKHRFKRMQGMKSYFGDNRFEEIVATLLKTIASPDHYSTATINMVIAKRFV